MVSATAVRTPDARFADLPDFPWKVLNRKLIRLAKHNRPFYCILQFPYVSRPMVLNHHLHKLSGDLIILVMTPPVLIQKFFEIM